MRPADGKTLTTTSLTRRSFVTAATGLASVVPALARDPPSGAPGHSPLVTALEQASRGDGALFAYVGTYSSAPVDAPPGKVDLPPGNGRGIHIFRVDRATGTLTAAGVTEH